MVRGSYSLNIFEQYRCRPVPRAGVGPRRPGPWPWQPMTGVRRRGQPAGAVEHDSARRCRQEPAAGALRRARLDHAADPVAEAAPMMPTLRADLHVHTCHSKVSGTCRFSAAATAIRRRPTSTASRRRAAWIWWRSPITTRSTARSSCSTTDPIAATTSSSAKRCRAGCPDGDLEVHLGVYGMTEALHRDLQPLREQRLRRGRPAARGRRVLRA